MKNQTALRTALPPPAGYPRRFQVLRAKDHEQCDDSQPIDRRVMQNVFGSRIRHRYLHCQVPPANHQHLSRLVSAGHGEGVQRVLRR